jgi:hypothetical protein
MGHFDVPEILIGVGTLVCIVLAFYNWTHPHPNLPK